jgi:flavin-dependent dehydrogenase
MGLSAATTGARRWGIRRHYDIAPWTNSVEVHWSRNAEAYVTPVADDCVGIAILSAGRGGFDRHFESFGELRDRVAGHAHGQDRAAGPLRQNVRSRAAGRVLLVGDAAGYIDALTGEGMGLAFGAAELLVDCIVADCPDDYDRQWRRLTRRYRMLTAALVHASAHMPVRSAIVPAAQALPSVFNRLVNLLAH